MAYRNGTSPATIVTRLRRICLSLPEAREKLSHGEPTWFAGPGKVFAALDDHHHGAAHLSVWLPQPPGAQEALIASDPDRFFRPPYVGPSGWVGARFASVDRDELNELLIEAWRLTAPKRLVAEFDESFEVV